MDFDVNVFEGWLREHFGATPPIGYCLRTDHRQRWLRIHSLPDAKRYAENELERSEVRRRAWVAAAEVLPTGAVCWLVVTGPPHENAPRELRLPSAPAMLFERVKPYDHPLLKDALEEERVVAYATQTTWPPADFDRLIGAIANDELRVVWFSPASAEVFAPYDGGIDLILESRTRMEALRRSFPAGWFSAREDGL